MNKKKTFNRLALGAILSVLLIFFFQNCAPAKLSKDGSSSLLQVTDSSSGASTSTGGTTTTSSGGGTSTKTAFAVGDKVDLVSLKRSTPETSSNILFPAPAVAAVFDYSTGCPMIENVVLKNNDFSQIIWVNALTATVVSVGDALDKVTYSPAAISSIYVFGYRNATPYYITTFSFTSKSATTLNLSSVGAIKIVQQVVSSDGVNELVLLTVDTPDVDLKSIQIIEKLASTTTTGKRAILFSRKVGQASNFQTIMSDLSGQTRSITVQGNITIISSGV